MLKCAGVVAVMLLSNLLCWGQSEEIERLNRVVQEQGQELEQLKAQLARIERALGMNAAAKVQPASFLLHPRQHPRRRRRRPRPLKRRWPASGSVAIFVSGSMLPFVAHRPQPRVFRIFASDTDCA